MLKKVRVKPCYGFLGLLGFGGFAGVLNSDFYMFFLFFSFFSLFFDAKTNYELNDERLQENIMRATKKLFDVSLIFILGCILAFNTGVSAEGFKIILSLYFSFLCVGKAYLTQYYEKYGI